MRLRLRTRRNPTATAELASRRVLIFVFSSAIGFKICTTGTTKRHWPRYDHACFFQGLRCRLDAGEACIQRRLGRWWLSGILGRRRGRRLFNIVGGRFFSQKGLHGRWCETAKLVEHGEIKGV